MYPNTHPTRHMVRTPTGECCADFHRGIHASMLPKSSLTSSQSKPLYWVHAWLLLLGPENSRTVEEGGWLQQAAHVSAGFANNTLYICLLGCLAVARSRAESSSTQGYKKKWTNGQGPTLEHGCCGHEAWTVAHGCRSQQPALDFHSRVERWNGPTSLPRSKTTRASYNGSCVWI